MIFATVGTQLPFDRLIRSLDEWAARNPHIDVFAQIGQTDYTPQHIRWEKTISVEAFRTNLDNCDTVVAHAGMGTIISAAELGKRIVILPRRADLGEHRNDHQLATSSRLSHLNGLVVAENCEHLSRELNNNGNSLLDSRIDTSTRLAVSPTLISEIRWFAGLEAA
jgi:UDP-N-acetylglucosamine transferase subunit ALG13